MIDGFIQPDIAERTAWVLINDSDAPASFDFYLYDETDAVTIDEITGTTTITPGGVFIYPVLHRPIAPTVHPLTGVFTSTGEMTLQIVGSTTRCPRLGGGSSCAEIRVPSGATTYSFYNYEANPDIIWVHNLYLDGVAQPAYSDIMSGPTVKHYLTGISGVEACGRARRIRHGLRPLHISLMAGHSHRDLWGGNNCSRSPGANNRITDAAGSSPAAF